HTAPSPLDTTQSMHRLFLRFTLSQSLSRLLAVTGCDGKKRCRRFVREVLDSKGKGAQNELETAQSTDMAR
ncbi:MAG: hypothetical protein ACQEUB_14760, partial [Thermodesulfobacteriota bacterium]